ncbi:hypothetical protein GQ54DRAFT_296398 [Martensiomyces pterosporus]|nr:hypothetical protein GQ54DRAFT_296398 [Martensiomyces pterosporus]
MWAISACAPCFHLLSLCCQVLPRLFSLRPAASLLPDPIACCICSHRYLIAICIVQMHMCECKRMHCCQAKVYCPLFKIGNHVPQPHCVSAEPCKAFERLKQGWPMCGASGY